MTALLERPAVVEVEEPPAPPPPPGRKLPAWLGGYGLLGVALLAAWASPDAGQGLALLFALVGFCLLLLALGGLVADFFRLVGGKPLRGTWLKAGGLVGLCTLGPTVIDADPVVGCGGGVNAAFRAQVAGLQNNLEDYAAAHDGHYPPARGWVQALELPAGALPRTRWAQQGQTASLAPAALGLPGAGALGALYAMHPMQDLGHGQRPAEAPAQADDFGAVLYDVDAKGENYVLYAIGKHNRHAELVGWFTNADVEALQVGPPVPQK